ncbi:MAG TPA: ATP-binding protein, partial [Thermoanaerobaculia bacterium]|nr:ATP-binding protein [Thermoanaerobaculia bacterium]
GNALIQRLLQNVPIRQKLILIIMLATGLALLLAGVVLILFDFLRTRREMQEDLTSLADVIAQNSTAVLQFDDPETAKETLKTLEASDPIVAGAIYDEDGKIFARYVRAGETPVFPERLEPDGSQFEGGSLVAFKSVLLENALIGTVYLQSDLSDLNNRLLVQAATVFGVFLLAGTAALLLSSYLQRAISRPLLHLADTARAVSEQRDYSIRAVKQSHDELGQLVDAFNDMLDQIQARDSDLQRAKELLEDRVRERTLELEKRNEELHQSNKELDDFAYIASHDLKEPLRGIHNFSTFLLEDYADKLDEDGRGKLETLTRLTRRMESLIDSLLHFSRLGRVDLAIDQVDLNAIVREAVDSLDINLKEAGIELRIPRRLPTVRADRARVGEIFYNLIVNAMKYNDKEKKWIEVGYLDPEEGHPPVFYIRDNGIGIQEKHFDSVFRIFKRLHARDKYGGGTGAGLTIVKKIVERHSGRIWVESAYGEGTTFYFTLEEDRDKGDTRAEYTQSADLARRG